MRSTGVLFLMASSACAIEFDFCHRTPVSINPKSSKTRTLELAPGDQAVVGIDYVSVPWLSPDLNVSLTFTKGALLNARPTDGSMRRSIIGSTRAALTTKIESQVETTPPPPRSTTTSSNGNGDTAPISRSPTHALPEVGHHTIPIRYTLTKRRRMSRIASTTLRIASTTNERPMIGQQDVTGSPFAPEVLGKENGKSTYFEFISATVSGLLTIHLSCQSGAVPCVTFLEFCVLPVPTPLT